MSVKVFESLTGALNGSNDAFASGFGSNRTGQESNMGGMLLGDAIQQLANEAKLNSNTLIGLLYEGQYRRVYVDPGATAGNIKRGTIAFPAVGSQVFGVSVLTPGAGQTPGTYTVSSTGGGGTGAAASISVVVGAAGTVTTPPTVIGAGSGFTSAPTFTLTGAGGTAATFQAQLGFNSYNVTTADIAGVNASLPRGVFLNAVTPGNYTWIQEQGIASVLNGAAAGAGGAGASVTPVAGGNGTVVASAAPNTNGWAQVGIAIDPPSANNVFRVLLTLPAWAG